jgi:hypothetical protein
MKKCPEEISSELFKVYRKECPDSIINYCIHDESKKQSHIVLDECIEIIYFEDYQGAEAIMFVMSRKDHESFFKTYAEALHNWSISDEEWDTYIDSITLK